MNYSLQPWRLLITPPARGAWNMAVDESIMDAVEQNSVLPTLRLYSWEPPCLSIGYAQPFKDIDLPCLNEQGWDYVRRPTGGRAILHTDELTYSVIAPLSDSRVSGGVLESYRKLSAALLSALHNLNIPAVSQVIENPDTKSRNDPVCFEVPSNYEIVVQGKKLIGSAQARHRSMVLQHGTLPLFGDLSRITLALIFPGEQERKNASERLYSHATTVETVLGIKISFQDAVQAFISGFKAELNLNLIPSLLTADEHTRTERLVHEKYTHPSWLERI